MKAKTKLVPERRPLPFDEVARRLLNTPPAPNKGRKIAHKRPKRTKE